MYKINFNKPEKAYFIGIGGISMSGLALLLKDRGFEIEGSDIKESDVTKKLEAAGIHINYGQVAENIKDNYDFVVYTAAIHPDNPEFKRCKELNLPMMERASLVGQIMKNYDHAIGVSGTHGKTTTTSMLSFIFLEADLDPTISVGGLLDRIDGNIRIGHSGNFITEACEYTNSFLKFFPTSAIILNVDADHLDFFKDLDDIRNSFKQFADLLPEDGNLVINGEIPQLQDITKDCKARIVTFGINGDFDFKAENLTFDSEGHPDFTVVEKDGTKTCYHLNVVGIHNVYNALSAIAMAVLSGVSHDVIQKGLMGYSGTHRRFEVLGKFNDVTVVDDYAHHPTEILATLTAAEKYPHNKLWVVFQPHTYSRTKALFEEFSEVLSKAENLIVADIYAAREKDPGDISSKMLADNINKKGGNATYLPSFDEIKKYFEKNCEKNDLLITMGAGNVVDIGNDLVK
ncbi:MAG: UDP-N-acetylmuramate--L-alanine ligase [Lachnospiraceae bacterium]|nr:UDP-N-acetylmuramate--L-alanine ligase [Lachnospiraceae bacterium]